MTWPFVFFFGDLDRDLDTKNKLINLWGHYLSNHDTFSGEIQTDFWGLLLDTSRSLEDEVESWVE